MAIEKFANLAETTLSAGYTSGGGSISVTSAAGFPTAGVFRVRLGNAGKTVYRVDSIAGTTFSGGAEANDANANSGETVKIVASKAVAERFLQSPESAELFVPAGVSGADRYGPLYKVVYPVTADYSWVNQGGAAVDDSAGYTRLSVPSAATSIRSRVKAAPGTPYQFTVMMQYEDDSGNKYGGIVFRESGTSKLTLFQFIGTTNNCQVVHFTNDTTFSSNPANTTLRGSIVGTHQPIWLYVKDDGTNLKFAASRDGKTYFTEMSIGRTSFMAGAPNQVGFFGNVDGGAGAFDLQFFHALVS